MEQTELLFEYYAISIPTSEIELKSKALEGWIPHYTEEKDGLLVLWLKRFRVCHN